ncbi:putative ABC transporter ATP-binding protein YjjK [Escherichia coli]|uniref:Putative ABC transporter ATP-binding protein YjjK n=1 Tax=Escherichia coli TaxID=562 RepID=A0A2X1Q090_ECOLX|nr:putative ABC transporter ATP-binding protein YjjK [Escherichia coli]
MISGQEQPDSGTITLGETVKLASVDQFRDSMDNSKNRLGRSFRRAGYYEDRQHRDAKPRLRGRFNFKGLIRVNAW